MAYYKFKKTKAFNFSVVNENVSLVISRQLLTDCSTHLALLPDPISQEVSHFALDVIQPRVISFEEQVVKGFCQQIQSIQPITVSYSSLLIILKLNSSVLQKILFILSKHVDSDHNRKAGNQLVMYEILMIHTFLHNVCKYLFIKLEYQALIFHQRRTYSH